MYITSCDALFVALPEVHIRQICVVFHEKVANQPEIEEAWAVEIERRMADVESGAIQVIPMPQALAQVRASLT